MNELILEDNIRLQDLIYEVRGKQVMLDSDLAKLFGYETKYLNRQVLRNKERFHENYCFRLTEEEYTNLRCQFGTSSGNNNYGGRRTLPYIFTEHGVTMLAGILKSSVAINMSLKIVDTFIKMRKFINSNLLEQKYVNNMVFEFDDRVSLLESNFKTFSNQVFYEGQIYDAHSLLLDIFSTSKESIIIIDNYISKELLDILSKTNKKISIYTRNIDNNLINKYKSQYNNITIKITNNFHDRFIIIDNKVLYHSGASFKDLGKKCFAINKVEDRNILNSIINHL